MFPRRSLLVALAGLLGTRHAVAQRLPLPAFKGMEVYSWQEGGEWRYALMLGTNRNKTWPELLAAALDEATLRQKLATLAVGENLSWSNACPGARLAYPPPSTVESLRKHCEELQLKLYIPRL